MPKSVIRELWNQDHPTEDVYRKLGQGRSRGATRGKDRSLPITALRNKNQKCNLSEKIPASKRVHINLYEITFISMVCILRARRSQFVLL